MLCLSVPAVVMIKKSGCSRASPEQVFARAHELEQVGLDVPQVTKVAAALRARGLDIDPAVYTVEALEQRLLALRGGAGAC